MGRSLASGCMVIACSLVVLLGPTSFVAVRELHAAEPIDADSQLDAFQLEDYRGKQHSLEDYHNAKVVVLAFIGCECPLVKLYAPRLEQLSARWGDDAVVLGVNSNAHDSLTEMAAFARRHGVSFPILKDAGNALADKLNARRTPEVFVFDAERRLRYHGRIDDQYGIGYARDEPKETYLETAVRQILQGKEIDVASVESVGCHIARVKKPDPNPKVTYYGDVAQILQKRCVECHRDGEIAPFALTDYSEVSGWADMIDEVVRDQRMPPWHAGETPHAFRNDRSMTAQEKQVLYDWVAAGAPEGDPADLEDVPTLASQDATPEWQLSQEPDFVAPISRKPVTVRAEGAVRYQYYRVDPKFTEDKWIQGVELRPGNRAVVHHILMFAGDSDGVSREFGGGARGFDGCYVPGQRAELFPPGYAKKIEKGSQLFFQVHYTPIGSEQTDQSHVGLVFADPEDVQFEIKTASAVNPRIRIPPNDPDYSVSATSEALPEDAQLMLMSPHMHLRGKAFTYTARLPGGERTTLLDVPRYDFNWQTAYRLQEPMSLPAGTRILCRAVFDNSEDNLNNPDPDRLVRWGEQTWDEMMIGYYDYAVPVNQPNRIRQGVRLSFERLDETEDGVIVKSELPRRLQGLFERFDHDGDGQVTLEEFAKQADRLR